MNETYVTDITHYLDERGEIVATMPSPARKLASFLTLVVEAASKEMAHDDHDTHIRCRKRGCDGSILASIGSMDGEIAWFCPVCGHNGVIRNWRGTKWDQLPEAPA